MAACLTSPRGHHLPLPRPMWTDPIPHLFVSAGCIQGDSAVAPVLALATFLADALLVCVAESNQRAVVGRAGPQIPVLRGFRQLVAVQFAVLLVWPQVLLTVIHHAGQTGLHCPYSAGPKTEVTQDLLLPLVTRSPDLCGIAALPLGFLSWLAQRVHILFFYWDSGPRVWDQRGQRVNADPGQWPWGNQIQFSHLEALRD